MGSESGKGWMGMVEKMIWWAVLGVAVLIFAVFGLKPVSEAYIPGGLMSKRDEKKSGYEKPS